MSNSRRDFLRTSGGLVMASSFIGAPLAAYAQAGAAADAPQGSPGNLTVHELPPLPYAYNALEPHIDEATMRLHHDKHHQAYVDGLNKAEAALAEMRAANNYDLVEHWTRKLAFNGGGHWLHSMFWKVMAAAGQGGGGEPQGALAGKIREDFGSYAAFKAQFSAVARNVEGSGWALLHFRAQDHRLLIQGAENQQKLTQWGTVPILGLDMWEHAYYLKYNNRRPEYVEAWWNVVNWGQVQANLEACLRQA